MRIVIMLLFLFLQTISVHADELLEPEQAFKFSAQLLNNKQIEIRYQIADGYYLYHNKFKFQLKGASAGVPIYPAGIIKNDPNFGSVEIYHHEVRIKLPFTRGTENSIALTSTAQGCAEAGVCYTPIESTKSFNLPVEPAPAAGIIPPAPATQPGGFGANDFLSPEQAFGLSMTLVNPTTISVHFKVAPQYYLYQDKIHFSIKNPTDISIGKTSFPVADIKQDPNFGQMKVYHKDFSVELTLNRALNLTESLQISSDYQGCSEKGICYPPQNHSEILGAQAAAKSTPNIDAGDNSQIAQALHSGRFWVVMVTFFGAGLLLAFTPCVFPMIPILSGIIAGQKQVTRLSGFLLSLAYVLGMAITYAAAGVAAALSGTLLSNALQNPIALFIGAAVFVALAFSMFGFFELQLPSAIQSKFSDASNKVKGGNFVGVFIMGALSALIVGPCVAPPLAAALAYIAQTGNTTLGGWALFSLAIGMGVPLLLIGLSAGTLLPRAGGWMNAVKYFFGVLMLAIAVWLVSPLLPIWVQMLLWATLLIVAATYLHALDTLPANASGWMRLWKGLGIILMLAGIALIVGMLAGGREVLQPLSVFKPGSAITAEATSNSLKFERVKNNSELDAKIKQSAGKVVMFDFYADWCVSCKEMEHNTFSDPRIIAKLKDVVLLQADITANSADDDAMRKRFAVFGPPALILFDKQGNEIREHIIGYQTPEQFGLILDKHLNP
jgi:thiol:disulfide interchange protein DsbD